jgi:hypothetical protein
MNKQAIEVIREILKKKNEADMTTNDLILADQIKTLEAENQQLKAENNMPKKYSMLNDELAGHPFHCPKCGSHLTSLFLCGECNVRYVDWANIWAENQRLLEAYYHYKNEYERLRKALEEIANPPMAINWMWFVMVANNALEKG